MPAEYYRCTICNGEIFDFGSATEGAEGWTHSFCERKREEEPPTRLNLVFAVAAFVIFGFLIYFTDKFAFALYSAVLATVGFIRFFVQERK